MSLHSLNDSLTSFFINPNYEKKTVDDLQKKILPTYSFESLTPLSKPNPFHRFIGQFVITGSFIPTSTAIKKRKQVAKLILKKKMGAWKLKRIALSIDGTYIDAMIIGTPNTLSNTIQKRWMLFSLGCADIYEFLLLKPAFFYQLQVLQTNCLIFNYPVTGNSLGYSHFELIKRTYQTALSLLENVIHPNEIILWGLSIGGAIQAQVLLEHPFKEDIRYVSVKDRTFSILSKEMEALTLNFIGKLIRVSGWEMNSLSASLSLHIPEIILQTTKKKGEIISDGVIIAKTSLARNLQNQGILFFNKEIFPLESKHSNTLLPTELDRLSLRVEWYFARARIPLLVNRELC
ncbi:MAG: hypothetical protein WCP39_00290 [Chlamydiota bacterium]